MKLLIVVPSYINEKNISYQFVHERVKQYQKEMEIDVFWFDNSFKKKYTYDGVTVYGGNDEKLLNQINNNNYDGIVFHYLNGQFASFIKNNLKDKKVFIWFHGSDSIGYKRRLCKFNFSFKKLFSFKYLILIRRFIASTKRKQEIIKELNQQENINFVFISNWHKETSEKDLKIKYKNYNVINNYIDSNKFYYTKKNEKDLFNVLSITSYANHLYGVDMLRDIILKFSKYNEFKYFTFNLYGDGVLFDEYTKPLKKFPNVNINKGFVNHNDIQELHNKNGIFLYPKRGDTQGVSRCEAMSSGLVSIASDIEAISEFSPENTSYLAKSIKEFIKHFIYIYNNKEDYLKKSYEGQKFIREKCSYENTIKKEIEMFKKVLK